MAVSTGCTESFDRWAGHCFAGTHSRFPRKKWSSPPGCYRRGLSVAYVVANATEKLPYLAHYERLIGYFKGFFQVANKYAVCD